MTKVSEHGIEALETMVEQHMIELPTDEMTTKDLEMWLRGYSECQNRVLSIISDFREMLENMHD